eukprot:3800296-Karenia_brevis.AAC.1
MPSLQHEKSKHLQQVIVESCGVHHLNVLHEKIAYVVGHSWREELLPVFHFRKLLRACRDSA